MSDRSTIRLPGGAVVHTAVTDRSDGDLCIDGPAGQLAARRSAVAPHPWTWLRQVHGARVVTVTRPGEHAGEPADAAVTAVPGAVLAVHTADCAGVLLWGTAPGGGAVVGAAHAGWRGLADGVLGATVAAMRELGARDLCWTLGPCISPAEYEFGAGELDELVRRLGPSLRASTGSGRPALDLRAGVAAALAPTGAGADQQQPVLCTAGSGRHWSWRARRDTGRQAAVVWIDPAPVAGT